MPNGWSDEIDFKIQPESTRKIEFLKGLESWNGKAREAIGRKALVVNPGGLD
jgi:hypothetical protein